MSYQSESSASKQGENSRISFTINQAASSSKESIKNSAAPIVEWAKIAPNKVIVASNVRAWLLEQKPQDTLQPETAQYFSSTMESAGSIATTRQLLDGAIAAAKYAVNSGVRPPALTARRWVWRLAGAYHLTHPVPQLLKEAARRFTMQGHSLLAEWATEKAKEEAGHDLLALRDIKSLGYNAPAVVKELVPPAATVLMNYFTRSIQDDPNPIDCVGYSYTMERMALGVDEKYIQKVEALLPQGVKATRCLRTHSSVGADAEHVEETIEMIAQLTVRERIRVARACYETALMCFSPCPEYMTDEKLQSLLDALSEQN
ncbi:MAG: iron-containing redox enzyme family protein [Cyanobacteria bacterium P01_C01_bin.72]